MQPVPLEVWANFERRLDGMRVPPPQRPDYRKWVRFYPRQAKRTVRSHFQLAPCRKSASKWTSCAGYMLRIWRPATLEHSCPGNSKRNTRTPPRSLSGSGSSRPLPIRYLMNRRRMRENHACLRGAGHRRRTSNLNIEPPTSNTQHPEPNTATKRKRQRKPRWISVPDQKWGPLRVLWYQGMSRVVPDLPQTSPRKTGEVGCIWAAYGKHQTLNLEP